MIKSPIGAGLAAAALLLALSPEARKTARKWAVKAAEAALDLSEQAKEATANTRKQLQAIVEEASADKHRELRSKL
ncbi:hypothetical protein SD70_08420 [Gordoniibacillus kamchatkensis]|uniref:YtxH domain-containing protein n=1 Tax=Gordoniibacillus kamchatkensis TaxID=1590651 RepID=A0ABR5AJP8_9BACL|nr:hypothetical protein [Paenibacillus sp. VKM B-2647]KIL41263.1 hypothetical protein SD70_08420 [Paenibacillus sp. VKM B-2647]